MWTTENRARYDRSKLRYPTDLTDAEWELIQPLISPAKRGGNKRTVDVREIVNELICLIPWFDGAVFSREWKEALWARFSTAAPQRQRQSVERYSIVKKA